MTKRKVFLVTDDRLPLKSLLGQIVAEEIEVELLPADVFGQLAQFDELRQMLRQREDEIGELRQRLGVVAGMPEFLLPTRIFIQELNRELSRSERYQQPLSCLMVQADQFPRIQEQGGAETEQRFLKELAELMRRMLRKSDLMGKLEDSILGIILPQTEGPGAVAVAEKLRFQVESYLFTALEDLPITISVGVVTFPRTGILAGEDLVRLGTYTLGQALEAGGNQVAVA